MPVALLVTVSSRLPGLLGPDGWRAVSSAPLVLALPGAAATAMALREAGEPVVDDGVVGLVRLLQQVPAQRGVGLLGVPRAAAG